MSLADKMISVMSNSGDDVVLDVDRKRSSRTFTCVSEHGDDVVVNEDVCPLDDARDNHVEEEKKCSSDYAEEGGIRRQSNNKSDAGRRKSLFQTIIDDFNCPSDDDDNRDGKCDARGGGDRKLLRAICRTATVNAAIFTTAASGGATLAPIVGFATGGAIAAKRLSDGIHTHDNREITKSVTVFGGATCASMIGQAVTTTVMLTVFHAALPLVAITAFGVGCCSGITVGAVSEWTVDSIIDTMQEDTNKCVTLGTSATRTWNELKQTWNWLLLGGNIKSKSSSQQKKKKSPDKIDNQETLPLPILMSNQSPEDEEQTNMSPPEGASSSHHSHLITPHSNEHKKIITSCNHNIIKCTKLLTTDNILSQLTAKKATLHEILRNYEDDFYKLHHRQVSSFDDIAPYECVYRQYKEIEIAIDNKKKTRPM